MGLSERMGVEKFGDGGRYVDESGRVHHLQGDEVVSMNMMGFTPRIFEQVEPHLVAFLEAQQRIPDNSECLLPVVVGKLVREKAATVRVLRTADAWFGVTHAKDKTAAVEIIRAMVERGDYPSPIWKER